MRPLIVLFSAMAVVAACSDAGPGNGQIGPVGPGPTVSIGAPVLGSLCDYLERCPNDFFAFQAANRGECIQALDFLLTCRVGSEPDEYGIDQWTVTPINVAVDANQLAACQAWLNASSCNAWEDINEGPCGALGGSFGNDDDDGGTPTETQLPAEGESCDNTYACQEGLNCVDFNGFPGYPTEDETDLCRVCVRPSALGEDCSIVACLWDESVQTVCDPDTTVCVAAPTSGRCVSGVCAPGFYCDNNVDTCVPRGIEGEECAQSALWCAEGLHCSEGLGTCALPEPDGAACQQDSSCTSGFCNGDLGDEQNAPGLCDSGGHEGFPCETGNGCRGHNCEPSLLVCIDKRADGDPCYKDYQCISGYCDTVRNQCGGQAGGSPCQTDADCTGGQCDLSTSLCGQPDGGSCNNDDDCQSGKCANGSCVTQVAVGESCGNDDQCVSDRCWGGICRTPCNTSDECAAGQWCDDWDARACVPLGEDGASCRDGEACKNGWCSSAERCGTKPQIGDACADDDCWPRGQCRGGVCVEQPGPGEACEGYDACLAPYACIDGTCTRMSLECRAANLGERCTFFVACADGLWCDPFNSFRCAAQSPEGGSCVLDWSCAKGHECSGGVCTAVPLRKADFESCDSSDECINDYCDNGICQPLGGVQCVLP